MWKQLWRKKQEAAAGEKPLTELRGADIVTTCEGKTIMGELENMSAHEFDVILHVHMKDADDDILGEEKAVLRRMRPHDIWRFKVPSPWRETAGFSLKVDVNAN